MIDLHNIITNTTHYNFHSHTQYCDGRDEMENFVKAAIEQGFEHYGFSPHSPIPIESPCNMNVDDVQSYLNEATRLKAKYGNRINLYTSMEIDYLGQWGPMNSVFQQLPLDYRIGSIHFLPVWENPQQYADIDGSFDDFSRVMKLHFNNDIESVVKLYYDQSLKLLEDGGFDIIAHFDKIGLNASKFRAGIDCEQWYEKLVRRNIEAIMDCHYIVEINTKAWLQHGRFFPNARYFRWLKRYNAPIAFNSDAHYPHLINAGREEAIALYNEQV